MTIEDIILDRDRRGISKLRQYLPADFCDQAAAFILENPGTAIIVTGFYILDAGADETDGPPGAIVIGNALEALGYDVVYVSDKYCTAILEGTKTPKAKVVEFPITDDDSSKKFATDLLAELSPSVVISIERCGVTSEGQFLNMRGRSISDQNAKTDHLFTNHPHTVGIGDGGNEIGLGNVAKEAKGLVRRIQQERANSYVKPLPWKYRTVWNGGDGSGTSGASTPSAPAPGLWWCGVRPR